MTEEAHEEEASPSASAGDLLLCKQCSRESFFAELKNDKCPYCKGGEFEETQCS